MFGLNKAISDNKRDVEKLRNSNHPNKDALIKHKVTKHCMLKDDLNQAKINKWLGK